MALLHSVWLLCDLNLVLNPLLPLQLPYFGSSCECGGAEPESQVLRCSHWQQAGAKWRRSRCIRVQHDAGFACPLPPYIVPSVSANCLTLRPAPHHVVPCCRHLLPLVAEVPFYRLHNTTSKAQGVAINRRGSRQWHACLQRSQASRIGHHTRRVLY
jgi:hypothetical protein